MNKKEIKELREKLHTAWSAATSFDANGWTKDNPSYGQCAVTACVVQDLYGGEIVHADAITPDGDKIMHFFNNIDGKDIDFTREQFPKGTVVPKGQEYKENYNTTREYVLAYPETVKRYELLKRNLAG
jgi:hypothetical protein